jgi:hypothetical protein
MDQIMNYQRDGDAEATSVQSQADMLTVDNIKDSQGDGMTDCLQQAESDFKRVDHMDTTQSKKAIHGKRIQNTMANHHSRSSVFDFAPAEPAPAAAPINPVTNKSKKMDQILMDESTAPNSPAPKLGKRVEQPAVDLVGAALDGTLAPEQKTRKMTGEEEQNQATNATDHISEIFSGASCPELVKSATATTGKTNLSSAPFDILAQADKPTDLSNALQPNNGKKIVNHHVKSSATMCAGVPYESSTPIKQNPTMAKHLQSSNAITGDTENVNGSNQPVSQSATLKAARNKMLGSHIGFGENKTSTPIKRSSVHITRNAHASSITFG